jgi:Protein of unknown function (DUF4011)
VTAGEPAIDGLKFSECQPRDLAARAVRARLADARGGGGDVAGDAADRHGDLLSDLIDKALAARLNRRALDAHTSRWEFGMTTLNLAFGRLRWFGLPDSWVELRVPLMLLPARLDRENGSDQAGRAGGRLGRPAVPTAPRRAKFAEVLEEGGVDLAITGVNSIDVARMIIIGVGASTTKSSGDPRRRGSAAGGVKVQVVVDPRGRIEPAGDSVPG